MVQVLALQIQLRAAQLFGPPAGVVDGARPPDKNNKINANANQDCYNAVYDAIRGADPTNDALFFYNPTIATCNWMKETQKINQTTIGHHTFFKIKD
jgi:spore germination cell wall hydrolase CwlJ-like protein